jgi:hypothetical protein
VKTIFFIVKVDWIGKSFREEYIPNQQNRNKTENKRKKVE